LAQDILRLIEISRRWNRGCRKITKAFV